VDARILRLIDNLPGFGLPQFCLAFGAIVSIRALLEYLSSPPSGNPLISDLLSLEVSMLFMFLFPVLALVIILNLIGKFEISKALSFVTVTLPVIWLAPILDMIISWGRGPGMSYIFTSLDQFLWHFLTFGGPLVYPGVTMGLRIEVAIVCIGILLVIFATTRNWARAILGTLLGYSAIFFVAILPSLGKILLSSAAASGSQEVYTAFVAALAGSESIRNIATQFLSTGFDSRTIYTVFNIGLGQIFWLSTTILLVTFGYLHNKSSFVALIRNLRPERLLYYMTLVATGALVATGGQFINIFSPAASLLSFVSVLFVFAYLWTYALIDNDLEDESIDRISNTGRPLVLGLLSRDLYRNYKNVALAMGLLGAYLLGYSTFFLALACALVSHIYSVPPLRLKRLPIISNAVVGLCGLMTFMAGYLLWSGGGDFSIFPLKIGLSIWLGLTVASFLKDLKDIEGDRQSAVVTLPTMLGQKRARLVILALLLIMSASFALVYSSASFLFATLAAGILLAGLKFWRGEINDKDYFLAYFVYIITLIIHMS